MSDPTDWVYPTFQILSATPKFNLCFWLICLNQGPLYKLIRFNSQLCKAPIKLRRTYLDKRYYTAYRWRDMQERSGRKGSEHLWPLKEPPLEALCVLLSRHLPNSPHRLEHFHSRDMFGEAGCSNPARPLCCISKHSFLTGKTQDAWRIGRVSYLLLDKIRHRMSHDKLNVEEDDSLHSLWEEKS